MGFKKIMLVAFLLLAILTIGTVSAADDNATSLAVDEDLILESSNDEVLSVDEGTFSDLSALINGTPENGVLELDNDYINNGSESEITISKAITIDGKGHKIDANLKSGIFHLDWCDVVIKNIKFVNAYSAAISGPYAGYDSNYDIINCSFYNSCNSAIYFVSESVGGVDIVNCTFVNNSGSDGGGAIDLTGLGTISNCTFVNNSARYGGAIYWSPYNSDLFECNIFNCIFMNNVASDGDGGAILLSGSEEDMRIYEKADVNLCTFVNNSASGNGGAICWGCINGILSNSTFENNSALHGGAVYCSGSNDTVSSCSFLNCHDNSENSAIYWPTSADGKLDKSNFTNSMGTIHYEAYSESPNVIMSNCNFNNTLATSLNEVIYGGTAFDCILIGTSVKFADLEISVVSNTTICNLGDQVEFAFRLTNNGPDDASNVMVEVAVPSSFVLMSYNADSGVFDGATWNIGNLNVSNNASLNLTCRIIGFSSTSISAQPGANEEDPNIFNSFASSDITVKEVANITIAVNDILQGENATIFIFTPMDATGNISVTVKTMNLTVFEGYSEIINGEINFNVDDLSVGEYEVIARYGGDIQYASVEKSKTFTVNSMVKSFLDLISLINSTSENTTLELDWDYQNDGSLASDGISISKAITIDGKGHTLDANSLSGIFEIYSSGVTFKNIIFKNTGLAAICFNADNGVVNNCTFVNCCSEESGGTGIRALGTNHIIANSTFINCSSNGYRGGAISVLDIGNTNKYTIANCTFVNCSADGGGAIYLESDTNITDSTFINCRSTIEGNAIYARDESKSKIINCIFEDSKAKSLKDVIYNGDIIINCTLNGNMTIYAKIEVLNSINEYKNGNFTFRVKDLYTDEPIAGATLSLYTCGNVRAGFTTTTDENGIAAFITKNLYEFNNDNSTLEMRSLEVGTYTVELKTTGNVESENVLVNLSITKANVILDMVVHEYENINVTVNVTNKKDGEAVPGIVLQVSLDNKEAYVSTDENGQGSFVLSNLTSGSHLVSVCTVDSKNIYYAELNETIHIPYKTFEDLAISIASTPEGNTLELNEDYVHVNGNDGIKITKAITIDGKGHTLDANGQSRVFNIEVNEVTLKNIVFRNGASSDGGAILWSGNRGTLVNCSFENCSAISKGGAILLANKSSGSRVDNSTFVNCSAEYGGSIYWDSDDGTVENSRFIDSVAKYGKAIYAVSDTRISNSDFANDNPNYYEGTVLGGVVYDCTFNGEDLTKSTPEIAVTVSDIEYGDNALVRVILPSDASSQVNITLVKGNKIIDSALCDVADGLASYEFTSLDVGIYKVNARFLGDFKYDENSKNATFTVRPKVTISQNVTVGDNVKILVDLNKATGTLLVKVDGVPNSIQPITNGKVDGSLSTSNLTARDHTVSFEYYGESVDKNVFNYWNGQEYVPVEYDMYLAPKEAEIPDEMDSDEDGMLEVEVGENATGTVEVFIDGISLCVVEVVDGIAKINMSQYKNGNYTVTFKYSGDEVYEAFTKDLNITVNNMVSKITASNVNMLYTTNSKYTVKVYDGDGNPANDIKVTFLIGGKTYGTATAKNGAASITIKNKVPGTYELTTKSYGVTVTKKLTVKHLLTLKKVTVKRSAKKLVLQATLAKVNKKYLKNKKITFKFNGKKYTAKTNKKGVAKVTIKASVLKKLKAGKKVVYQATYLNDTVKKDAKVKK